jgi:hypothetical protein
MLALVKWLVKKREKDALFENHGMEFDSQNIPGSIGQPIGTNDCKKIKNGLNRGGNGL